MSPKALPGFRDFYPEQLAEREYIFAKWRDTVRKYAFVEYDGPPLEPLDLYTQKSGDEIVTQLYNFEDKGGRAVALRPEMTPTFARMVGAKAQALRKPVRWFSIPQLFRYERQQKGRLREHYQLNVDIVGEASELADAELLAVAIDIMRSVGLASADVRARVSDRRLLNGLLEHLAVTDAQLPAVYAVLDKLDRQPRDISAEKLASAGVSMATAETILGFGALSFSELQQAYGSAELVAPHAARFAQYLEFAEALGIVEWIRFDLTIVRGLAYYTGIVFELFDAVGEFRAICGGGRYDNLLSSLGGVDLPALGFGMGDVVLGELLRERGKMPALPGARHRVFIVADDGTQTATVLRVGTLIRRHLADVNVSYPLSRSAIETRKANRQIDDGRAAGANLTLRLTSRDSAPAIEVASIDGKMREFVPPGFVSVLLTGSSSSEEEKTAAMHVHEMARRLIQG